MIILFPVNVVVAWQILILICVAATEYRRNVEAKKTDLVRTDNVQRVQELLIDNHCRGPHTYSCHCPHSSRLKFTPSCLTRASATLIGRIQGAIVARRNRSERWSRRQLPRRSPRVYTTGDSRRDDRSDSRGDDRPVHTPYKIPAASRVKSLGTGSCKFPTAKLAFKSMKDCHFKLSYSVSRK